MVKQAHILLILCLSFLTACSQNGRKDIISVNPDYDFSYDLAEPNQSWKLPAALVEISGLGFIDNQRLACVQDEKGIIYVFNLNSGGVEQQIVFGDDGDYEGIEIIENDAWILKSNGTLFEVPDYLKKAVPVARKHATPLSGKNDTEGLAYDPAGRSLLIACKGNPFPDETSEEALKAIYRFNLDSRQVGLKPFLLINLDTIRFYLDDDALTRLGLELQNYADPSGGDATFQPSGIAIHPSTEDIFILGSAGKLLVVMTGKGELLAMIKLNPKIFVQPEGICFSPDGTLYIANEGDGREGTILRFEPGN